MEDIILDPADTATAGFFAIGGNVSEWSNIESFRLVFDDRSDHGGGDSKKACGISAPAFGGRPGSLGLAALLVALALAMRRR